MPPSESESAVRPAVRALPRRALLAGIAGGVTASLAGCPTSSSDDEEEGLAVAEDTVIGTEFTVRLGATDVDRVDLSVVDGRGETFSDHLELGSDAADGRVPLHELRDDEAVDVGVRTDASSEAELSSGLGGTGPLRMVAHHLAAGEETPAPAFLPGDRLLAPEDVDGGYDVTVEASVDGDVAHSATATRQFAAHDVSTTDLPGDDLIGTLATPPTDDPAPGVVVLHGSGATDLSPWSRMLAAHGYAALTLRYFAEPGLPETLDDVPLEYFDRAVSWLTDREDVLGDRVGFVGLSRGVEPALLTAAGFEGTATVVGYGGSGIVHPGLTEVYALDRENPPEEPVGAAGWEAAWTRGGDPIVPGEAIQEVYGSVGALDLDELEPVGIDVEAVDGPVLLLSGGDDALWPAPVYSEYAVRRLAAADVSSPFAHVTYDAAGHLFFWPYRAYDGLLTAAHLGGTPTANARAAADAWIRCLDYLEAGLAGDES